MIVEATEKNQIEPARTNATGTVPGMYQLSRTLARTRHCYP
jgi:hypothetical protein